MIKGGQRWKVFKKVGNILSIEIYARRYIMLIYVYIYITIFNYDVVYQVCMYLYISTVYAVYVCFYLG